jgi:hypothetical protein
MKCYIEVNGKPVAEPDVSKWGAWFEQANRTVADMVTEQVRVSTVFLGIDHSFGGGEPLLYETMIFGGKEDGYQKRYSTRENALVGHGRALEVAGL